MRRRVGAGLLALGLLSGCGEKCTPGTDLAHCEGTSVVSCPPPGVDQVVGANRWVHSDCAPARVCVAAGGEAFCALSATPSTVCADAGPHACSGATAEVFCQSGFETFRTNCLSCTPGDAGPDCRGGASSPCTSNAGCAPPLLCSHSFCSGAPDGG